MVILTYKVESQADLKFDLNRILDPPMTQICRSKWPLFLFVNSQCYIKVLTKFISSSDFNMRMQCASLQREELFDINFDAEIAAKNFYPP